MNPTHDQFEAVVRVLFDAMGESNAVTLNDLVTRAGLPNRRTAEVLIEQRLKDFPYPLVASGAGFFRPTVPDHLNHAIASLRSRAMKILHKAKTIRMKADAAGWKRDGRLFARPPAQLDLFEKGQTT